MSMVISVAYSTDVNANEPNLTYQVYEKDGVYYLKSDPSAWVPIGVDITIFIPTYEEGQVLKLEQVGSSWQVSISSASEFQSISPTLSNAIVQYSDIDNNGYTDMYFTPNGGTEAITLTAMNSWYDFIVNNGLPGNPQNASRRVIFIHTDLLGTPVAETDENGVKQ